MPEQGIGLQITFAADKQLKRFLKDIPQHIGNSFEPEDIHATIIYPEEIARAGLGNHERSKLVDAEAEITELVEELAIEGQRLDIAPNILRPYKKFFGIEIIDENNGICDRMRGIGAKAIERATGIKLRDYLDSYHMSVARRNKGDGRRRPLQYQRHFPADLVVSGFNTQVRTLVDDLCGRECYVNDLQRIDPNRLYS